MLDFFSNNLICSTPCIFVSVSKGPFIALPITASIAILLIGVLLTYFLVLNRTVPRSKRRLRRANTMVQAILILVGVYALSIADPQHDPATFVIAWIGVILLSLLTVGFAVLDSLNNIRIHRIDRAALHADK